MKTASAGTVESMDCIVTASEADPGSGVVVQLAGASVARFGSAMQKAARRRRAALLHAPTPRLRSGTWRRR